MSLPNEIQKRRTFAIISHPDAGKTTLTEKLLLYGGAIVMAGTVKGRKASRHATSDWMALEKQRGISVTTSVMQFPYREHIMNLLDTPGHEDFSEDTYRTLTAVDSALMVIDVAKGVEERTVKLMDVCRLRDTPIITFVNKMDRYGRTPLELMDEIESVLSMPCVPMTWPIGMGPEFKGVFDFKTEQVCLFESGRGHEKQAARRCALSDLKTQSILNGADYQALCEELDLVRGASCDLDEAAFLRGEQTVVYFGSALQNFGVEAILDAVVTYAPKPLSRPTQTREVLPEEKTFSGFVFKIQANMDPQHRDRMAFMRICSGAFEKGMKLYQVSQKKEVPINQALTFMASDRVHLEKAYPGDIIGIYNHGTIQLGDTFTQGETLQFTGLPYFAPELFNRVRLKDPLKLKALQKGLLQLSEEGATQVFKPLKNQDLILGAVGALQFDVVAFRLKTEYNVDCVYEPVAVQLARWVTSSDPKALETFCEKYHDYLALDAQDAITYLAPSRVNLSLAQDKSPLIRFSDTREHGKVS